MPSIEINSDDTVTPAMMRDPHTERESCVLGVTSSLSLQFVRPLAQNLADRGWTVDVVASFENGRSPLEQPSWREHNLRMVRRPSPLKDSASLARWSVLLSRKRPSVVVMGTPKAALLGLLAARLVGVEHRVLLLHGLRLETSLSWSKVFLVLIERLTAGLATRIIAVSPSLAEKYSTVGFASPGKIDVLGSGSAVGIDSKMFAPFQDTRKRQSVREQAMVGLSLDPKRITFGYIGRITHDKGISDLVAALRRLEAGGHSVQCLFVGEEEEGEKILHGLASIPLARVIPWTSEIGPIYCCIDVLCLPSFREGMPTVALEAAMMQIPTIGARSTGIVDAIQHEKTGLLVEQRDPLSLAEAMLRLAKNPKLRATLGKNAQNYVSKHFDQEDVVARYSKYLEQLVTTPAGSGLSGSAP